MMKKIIILFLLILTFFLASFFLNLNRKTILAAGDCEPMSITLTQKSISGSQATFTVTATAAGYEGHEVYLIGEQGISTICSKKVTLNANGIGETSCDFKKNGDYNVAIWNTSSTATGINCSDAITIVITQGETAIEEKADCLGAGRTCVPNVTQNICPGYKCCLQGGTTYVIYPENAKQCETTKKVEKALEEQNKTETTETPDLAAKVNKIVNYSMGIGGIIAFLLIVFGGFQIILSAGNPDRVKAGKEMITSAIAGLLLIIFSVFILRVIGYDILRIPGFGK